MRRLGATAEAAQDATLAECSVLLSLPYRMRAAGLLHLLPPIKPALRRSMAATREPGAAAIRLAVGQMTSTGDTDANLAACSRLASQAAAAGACMLSLPECCTFLGDRDTDALAVAERLPQGGRVLAHLQGLARTHKLWLSLGGVPEASDVAGKRYNTHVVLDSNGVVRSTYRKVHLFDLELPGQGVALRESNVTLPGTEAPPVVETPVGRCGLAVCYDLRFSGLFSGLVHRPDGGPGADVLLIPAAFTVPTGEAHWETLLRARAIENQCYVAAAAQGGQHSTKRASYGHAMIVDPWGTVVARVAEGPVAEGIAVADIDHDWLRVVRERMPLGQHRRPDVYSN